MVTSPGSVITLSLNKIFVRFYHFSILTKSLDNSLPSLYHLIVLFNPSLPQARA